MAHNDAAVRLAELVQPIPPLLQIRVGGHRQREMDRNRLALRPAPSPDAARVQNCRPRFSSRPPSAHRLRRNRYAEQDRARADTRRGCVRHCSRQLDVMETGQRTHRRIRSLELTLLEKSTSVAERSASPPPVMTSPSKPRQAVCGSWTCRHLRPAGRTDDQG
jgi:hypothetical protein